MWLLKWISFFGFKYLGKVYFFMGIVILFNMGYRFMFGDRILSYVLVDKVNLVNYSFFWVF